MSAEEVKVADEAARLEALDTNRSFVVQAPAGSGKTGLLVQRFLALLAKVEQPESVLAITFTRKAAGEMRRRIVQALRDAADASREPVHSFEKRTRELALAVLNRDAARGDHEQWRLLESPSRLQVFTIDGFCARVVGSVPLVSRLGSTPVVAQDPERLYREAVRRTLSSAGRHLLHDSMQVLLERYEMGIERLEEQLVTMLGRREQWGAPLLAGEGTEDAWVTSVQQAFEEAMAQDVAALHAATPVGLRSKLEELARRSRGIVDEAPGWPTLGSEATLGPGAADAWAWKQAAALLTKDGKFRNSTTKSRHNDVHGGDKALKQFHLDALLDLEGLHGSEGDACRAGILAALKLPVLPHFGEDGLQALRALCAVLRHAAAELWLVFREHGEVDFTEVGLGALRGLSGGDVLDSVQAGVEHILVDEFQDTNVQQCDLLRALTSGWSANSGRTVFLVGDPMQSIYRFRKAEVGLFLAARSAGGNFLHGLQLTPLALSVNFRSSVPIVQWVNQAFSRLLGDRDDASRSRVAFAAAEPSPTASSEGGVELLLWDAAGNAAPVAAAGEGAAHQAGAQPAAEAKASGKGKAKQKAAGGDEDGASSGEGGGDGKGDGTNAGPKGSEADAVEAIGLARWISQHVRALRERGEGEGEHRDAPVAVLVRARSHVLPLLRALESEAPELRVRAPGLDFLGERVVPRDLEALARCLWHPGDRLAWLAVLRSVRVGLSLADLSLLVEHDVHAQEGARKATAIPQLLEDPEALARVSEDARTRIARLLEVLAAGRRDSAVRRPELALRAAWLRLGGPASLPPVASSAAGEHEAWRQRFALRSRQDALDAEAFLDLVAAHSRGGVVDLDEVSRALARTEAPVDREAEVDVEVMTMHKAKGLEFDTVVLPALGRTSTGSDLLPLAMETRAGDGRLSMVAPRAARGRGDDDRDKYEYLQAREKERQQQESLRLLYVATTRARQRLVLSASCGRLTKKDRLPVAKSLLNALEPVVAAASAATRPVEGAELPKARPLLRLPAGFRLATRHESVADRSLRAESPSMLGAALPTLAEADPEAGRSARLGTVYHAWMERIATEGTAAWPLPRLAAEEPALRHALRSAGVLAHELDECAVRLRDAVASTLADERGRWILAAHDDARSELPLTALQGDRLTSAVLDRTFVAEGTRWIIDFKTGRLPEDPEDKEARGRHVEDRRVHYAPQLSRYRELLQEQAGPGGPPVRMALYFPEWPEELRWQEL